jgi:hemoglobin
MSEQRPVTVYDVVGEQYFVDLVDRFYDRVAEDPLLGPMHPPDLTESRRNTAGFLVQYWGGPADYSERRGHPRLRMRHLPFAIGVAEREAWLAHMTASVEESDAPDAVKGLLLDYFEHASRAMINQPPNA